MTTPVFPEWLQGCLVEDAAFLRAYEGLDSCLRSWLKLCIARIHGHYGQKNHAEECFSVRHASGMVSRTNSRPLHWALVLFDGAFVAPARLLAALMPPILSGVEELAVVRAGVARQAWPAPLLAALELAGVEQVFQCGTRSIGPLLEHVAQCAEPGIVLLAHPMQLSRDHRLLLAQAPHVRTWCAAVPSRVGIFATDAVDWDMEALAWNQPDLGVELWSECDAPALPEGWVRRHGDPQEFLRQRFPVAYAPLDMHEKALQSSALVLGPGHEACWLWPELQSCLFLRHAAALGDWSRIPAHAHISQSEE